MPRLLFVGVDVGTSSARAALISSQGQVLRQHIKDIKIWNPLPNHYEQSSSDIWTAVCECVRSVVQNVTPEEVAGISFDATCSLVLLERGDEPLTVSTTGNNMQNIILWMDHRADSEAEFINATGHNLLNHVGGKVSLEMELPKLLWLKKNLQISSWSNIWRAFDLPDFLTWKSTGCDSRSLCSVVCKWNYDALNNCWDKEFLKMIGLEDLCDNNFEIIGSTIKEPGTPVGNGLTREAAQSMGLLPNTPVGTSLIDAHAGALGLFGCNAPGILTEISNKMAIICGTSTCHMSLTREPCWAKGVWGPYKSAIIPDLFLNEGGQSATGAVLDFIIKNHPSYLKIKTHLEIGQNIYSYLNELLEKIAHEKKLSSVHYLTENIHVWPDLHGNRSPIADPTLKGMICGLDMKANDDSLAITYLAFVQALSYGTRHIIENLENYDRPEFSCLLFSGGMSKNQIYVQTHADACNLPVILPNEKEMVLVGAAMLGACAAKVYPNLESASEAMGGTGKVLSPRQEFVKYHNKKYQVFLKMLDDQKAYRALMEQR